MFKKNAAPAAGGYTLTKSLRFRSSASAYLNRTPASAGNRQKWTWSAWVKKGDLGAYGFLFWAGSGATDTGIYLETNNTLFFNGNNVTFRATTQVFRDLSAWYHIVVALDTTQATAANRVLMYVNGVQITAFVTNNTPTLNDSYEINNTTAHYIGKYASSGSYFDGYLAEVNFVDGQALTPSSFGETSSTTGVWIPKQYSGTYGTNGFYLPFTNTTSTSTLGNDSSGNGNNWTTNNFSLTAGTTYDSMTDVPTNTNANTANYATLNPLSNGSSTTITNGNLTYANTGTTACNMYSTIGMTTGKFYCEVTISTNQFSLIGISDANIAATSGFYQGSGGYGYYGSNGNKYNNNTNSGYGATFTAGDVMGIAFDADAGTLTFYKNNVSQGTAYTGIPAGTYFFAEGNQTSTLGGSFNFGQQPFTYTPPSGFVALNTYNLPTPTIGATASTQANDYFNAVLYTGNGSTNAITGVGFQPDFVWGKSRSNATSNFLYDAVRGVYKRLISNSTAAETDETGGGLSSFNSDGFTVQANSTENGNTRTFVAWNWKANGAGSSNTAGSVTSTVSANTTAGFSIVTWTMPSTAGITIGHGLGVAPAMYIVKSSATTSGWATYHKSLGAGAYLTMNTTAASTSDANAWSNTAPTSSVFTIGTSFNGLAGGYVGYCFAEVAGYSAFGSYTGNGSTDGTFVYTGFRPRFIMIKASSTTGNWNIIDTARNTTNVIGELLYADASDAGATYTLADSLSNGFKLRNSGGNINNSGTTFIYMAFAESPFKYANAR